MKILDYWNTNTFNRANELKLTVMNSIVFVKIKFINKLPNSANHLERQMNSFTTSRNPHKFWATVRSGHLNLSICFPKYGNYVLSYQNVSDKSNYIVQFWKSKIVKVNKSFKIKCSENYQVSYNEQILSYFIVCKFSWMIKK